MKKIFNILIIFAISVLTVNVSAQTFEIKIVENDYSYLEVQMRETSGTGTPTTATIVNDISFEIRWLTTLSTDVAIICSNNGYNLADALGSLQTNGSYSYRVFQAATTPLNPPENWTQNTWMTIATFKATSGSGSGSFEIAPDLWVAQGLNWNQGDPPVDYTPTVNGQADSYTYPTTVYDLVWTGADVTYPTYWDIAGNWETICGAAGSIPNTGNNCVIPVVSSGNYPINIAQVSGGFPARHQPFCDYLRINAGASISIDNQDEAAGTQVLFTVNNNLINYGTIAIVPNGELTVTGSTYIDAATGIIVQADATGVGSFIDNGTITYGGSGTAKVQTYLTNSAGSGNFDIHLVGPTVDLISGGTNGALLSAFNLVNGNTYAYDWDESVGFASGWQNIYDNSYVVNTGAGIGLSTDDGSANTLEMTGTLMTGNISSPSLTFSNNHNELISNPYPSAIDFDDLANDNSGVVQNKYWIWNPVTNTYVSRAGGTGGSQYIQVGQGFFVETTGAGTFDFINARRSHSNDPFRSTIANLLSVKIVGGIEGYADETFIRFDDDATSGYDIEIEAEKWESENSDATQIKTIAEDNAELAINVLPTASLLSGMTSVPMHFTCGYNTEYTLSFYDMDSFETSTEIWLEDKQTGDDWISVNDNPDYTFTATPDDLDDRFVIHFFGTTGVNEFEIENSVEIFSYRQNAFVRNNTNEVIKTVSIYTLAGKLLQNSEPTDIKLNKFWVSNSVGYFVVRVITNKNVYTQKVFISK